MTGCGEAPTCWLAVTAWESLCQSHFLRSNSPPPTRTNREETMRGVVFTGERRLELMQFLDPTPDAHDVVIEMKASGMCGSYLHQYRRPKGQARATGIPVPEGPVIAGHEPCGVVVAVGTAVGPAEARKRDGASLSGLHPVQPLPLRMA